MFKFQNSFKAVEYKYKIKMTKRKCNKKQHIIVKTNKKNKHVKESIHYSAQSSDSTKETIQEIIDIDHSVIVEKSNNNLAYYMYLNGLELMKENNKNLNFGSSFLILKAGFYGCSNAVFYIIKNLSTFIGCILGFKDQELYNDEIYQEAYFILGFFLFYSKEIKKHETFLQWLNSENPDLIIEEESDLENNLNNINFTTFSKLKESLAKQTNNSFIPLNNKEFCIDDSDFDNYNDEDINQSNKKSPIVITKKQTVKERNNNIKKKLSFTDFNNVKNINKKNYSKTIQYKKTKYDVEIPKAKARATLKQILHNIEIFKEEKYSESGLILLNKQTHNKNLSEILIKLKYYRLNPHNPEMKKTYLDLLDKHLSSNNEFILFLYAYQYLITNVMKLDVYLKEKNIEDLSISTLIPKDKIQYCISLLELSANKNFYLSQYYLSESRVNVKYNAYMNDKEAFYYMNACCENGMNIAYYHLSDYYKKSIGVHSKIKHKNAFEYMKKAYECNHYEAGVRLAIMYKEGDGVEQNKSKAYEIIKKCYLDYKITDACYLWGLFFFEGIGCKVDEKYGMKCLKLAALKGHKEAIVLIGKIYMFGEYNIEKDYDQAFHYFKTAAKFKIHEGICWLAIFFFEYIGNKSKFKHFLMDAICQNYKEVLSFLYKNKHYFSQKLLNVIPYGEMEYIKKKLQKLC